MTEKEIHKTEYVDKQLPTIFYKKETTKDLSLQESVEISVSGNTSVEAFVVFKKVKEELL